MKVSKNQQTLLKIWLSTALATIITTIKIIYARLQQTLSETFPQHGHLLATQ